VVLSPFTEQLVIRQYFLKATGLDSVLLANRYLHEQAQMRNVKIDGDVVGLDRDVKHLSASD